MNPTLSITLALVLVVVASFCFAGGATMQHLAVGRKGADADAGTVGLRKLARQMATPVWAGGLGLIVFGALLHLTALTMAPIAVVQPVGILAVPWSVLLAARLHHHAMTRAVWGAVALTVVGIVGFTVLAAGVTENGAHVRPAWVFWATGLTFAIAAVLILPGLRGPAATRCLAWAGGGAVLYGLASALMKTVSEAVKAKTDLTHPVIWLTVALLLVAYVTGGWMIQQGYASGPAEIVVGAMTTIDPLLAVVFGLVVLQEASARLGVLAALGMTVFGALSIAGVVLLSRHHPEAVERREAALAQASDPAA